MLCDCLSLNLLPESKQVAGTCVRCRFAPMVGLAMLFAIYVACGLFAPLDFAFADAPALSAPAAAGASPAAVQQQMRPYDLIFGSVQFFLVGLFILWMLYLRPLQRREDSQRKFLAELKKNDDVLTSGGIFGKVLVVKPDEVTIEVSPGVKLRIKPDHLYPIVNAQRETKSSPLQIAGKEQGR